MISLPPLYAITDRSLAGGASHARIVASLCRGGAALIQLREKSFPDRALLDACREAVAEARAGKARLIVNDRADVAALAGADGVHLGDADLHPGDARRVLEGEAWIGRSSHGVAEAIEAARLPVDYVAIGPIFPTGHARVRRPALGVEAVARAASALPIPLVAIGGITLDNAEQVIRAGAASVAVMGDLMTAHDIAARTAAFVSLLRGLRGA